MHQQHLPSLSLIRIVTVSKAAIESWNRRQKHEMTWEDVVCVLLRSRRLSAHSVFLVVAGCLGPCLCAPVLASFVRARGLAFRLGVCLSGFPAVVSAVTPFPVRYKETQ